MNRKQIQDKKLKSNHIQNYWPVLVSMRPQHPGENYLTYREERKHHTKNIYYYKDKLLALLKWSYASGFNSPSAHR